MALWGLWEGLFARLFRLRAIPGDPDRYFRLSFQRWRGGEVRLASGEVVRNGDWVAELHLNSPRCAREWDRLGHSTVAVTAQMAAQTRVTLGRLAAAVEAGRLPVPVVAFYGRTLLHRGARRLGMEVHELAGSPGHRWIAAYERWLMILYHPAGLDYREAKGPLKMIWVSAAELVRRFAPGPTTPRRATTAGPT